LHREAVAAATIVANPGCYPTAALLALTPLKSLGLVDVIIDAKSGVSGAGKAAKATTHFCSVDSDLVAYGVQSHRHYPEIAAGLAGAGAGPSAFGAAQGAAGPALTFVPHLVPLQRGISETIYVRPATFPLPSAAHVKELYEEFYAGEQFVEVCDAPPQLKDVAGTNYCRIFAHVDERAGRLVVISVIDNLMKGASGQAVQNLNVMLGLPEHEGLV
jgi:N-acetyl-gamma-glutamyl-phosphate reductase